MKKTQTKENDHEMWFRWYLEELLEYGYIESFTREGETFTILPGQKHERVKHYASKANSKEEFVLLSEMNYTYDFRIIWSEKAKYLFYEIYYPNEPFVFGRPYFVAHELKINDKLKTVSYVDVKPHRSAAEQGGKVSTFYTFPYVQKIAFYLYKLYFNKIIPVHAGKKGHSTCLFSQTFVPNRYLFTDKSGALRTIPYSKRSIKTFVKNRELYIKKFLPKINQQKLL